MGADLTAGWLLAGLLASGVGMGLFLYGKKQRRLPQMLGGLALMVFPGFVSSAWLVLAVAATLVGATWAAVRAGI